MAKASLPAAEQPPAKCLTRPAANPRKRPVTTNDCSLFESDPAVIVDKQFILDHGGSGDILYEIVEVSYSKGGWVYQVRFEGCSDTVEASREDMMGMLRGSSLVEV
jgi:hypothetical protein